MTRTAQIETKESNQRQRAFAKSLVDTLGIDKAIQTCRENHWGGVLELVSKNRAKDQRQASDRRTSDRMVPVSDGIDFTGWHPYTVEAIAVRQGIDYP
jgi:hypothetical protein